LNKLPEEAMGVETKQDALVNLPEEKINEYKGKAFVA